MRTILLCCVCALLLLVLPACGSPQPREWTGERQLIVIKPELVMAQINATLLNAGWKRDIDEQRTSLGIPEPRETHHQALRCHWSRHKPAGVSALDQVGERVAGVAIAAPMGVVIGAGMAEMTDGTSLVMVPAAPVVAAAQLVSPLEPPEFTDQLRFAVHPHPDGALVLAAYDTPVAAHMSREVYAAVFVRAQAELRREGVAASESTIAHTPCTAPH
jgi:hypothetical protein